MSAAPREPRIDEDGVRISRRDGAATSARLLGVVLVTAALAIVAVSAVAVWWLRHDAPHVATPAAVPRVEEEEPVQRIAAHGVPSVESHTAAAPPAREPHQPRPVRRTTNAPNADSGAAPDARPAAAVPGGAQSGPGGARAEPAPPPAGDQAAARAEEREKQELGRIANEVVAGMRAAGETTGLAAIPPPGTNPVKSGLVVPRDYPLPEGYVRHYQMTDDGKRLEAILMFSPDYSFVDDAGNPIELPKDGIVPPEMAPPGLPLRTLEVPGAARPKSSAPAGNAE